MKKAATQYYGHDSSMALFSALDNVFALLQKRSRSEISPEARLALAVLEDAINIFYKRADAKKLTHQREFIEVESWILNKDTDWPFSFVNVCSMLQINASWVRARLLHIRDDIRTEQPTGLKKRRPRVRANVQRQHKIQEKRSKRKRKPA